MPIQDALLRSAIRLDRAVLPLAGIAALALATGLLLLPGLAAGLAATSLGGVLLLASGGVRWIASRHQVNRRQVEEVVAQICEEDPAACFIADEGGRVLQMNRSARGRSRGHDDRQIVQGLADVVATPAEVFSRLLATAQRLGSAREELATGRQRGRVSVTRIGAGLFLWRFDDGSAGGGASPEVTGLPMLIASRQGRVLAQNPAMQRLLGLSDAELEAILPSLHPRPGAVQKLRTARGKLRVRMAEYSGPTGRREIYLIPAHPEADEDASDWSLADDFPVPMLQLSLQGRVSVANARARELLGPTSPEGREFSDLVEGLGQSIPGWLAEAARGPGLRQPEVVRVIGSDTELYLQVRLGRLERDGESELVAVLNDLTELKSLEAQFVQSQKMQAIGQLAGGVAHDFNNLLTAISGHCDLLLLRHDPTDADHADLQQISQNANRAAALVRHLLAFSRKQNLQTQVLALRDLMADHAHLLNRLVGERVKLVLDAPEDLPNVRADRRQLEQVMMNLAVNARDAMPQGGEIRVTIRAEHLERPLPRSRTQVPQGDWLVIRVRDQGIGIPPERHAKIFEPFFTTKKAGEGTGLGLSTVYGIVKQSGGYVFLESEVGAGTEFEVWLPALPPDVPVDPVPAPAQVQAPSAHLVRQKGQTGVVLLVEDEAAVRAFAGRALRLRGHTVIETANAEEALATLTDPALHVDVIVTDVIMPGQDGPTWVRSARQERPDVGVVFISGYAEESMAEHQARIPGAAFLPKPFSLSELSAVVQEKLG